MGTLIVGVILGATAAVLYSMHRVAVDLWWKDNAYPVLSDLGLKDVHLKRSFIYALLILPILSLIPAPAFSIGIVLAYYVTSLIYIRMGGTEESDN